MSPSDARKRANAKWDKANMTVLGCKVKKTEAEAFKAYCAAQGKTANTELKDHVLQCIEQHTREDAPDGD